MSNAQSSISSYPYTRVLDHIIRYSVWPISYDQNIYSLFILRFKRITWIVVTTKEQVNRSKSLWHFHSFYIHKILYIACMLTGVNSINSSSIFMLSSSFGYFEHMKFSIRQFLSFLFSFYFIFLWMNFKWKLNISGQTFVIVSI